MRPCYLDASALVKLVVDEKGSERLREYFESRPAFFTASLCFGEALGVLKVKYLYRSELDERAYSAACFTLVTDVLSQSARIKVEDLDFEDLAIYNDVNDTAKKHRLDFSDALQIVILRRGRFSCFGEPESAVLVTGDAGLAKATRAEGLLAWNVCEEEMPPGPEDPSPWGGAGTMEAPQD